MKADFIHGKGRDICSLHKTAYRIELPQESLERQLLHNEWRCRITWRL